MLMKNLVFRCMLGITYAKLLRVFPPILHPVIMKKEKLEPYEKLVLSVKGKMETRRKS
jgi:hypothetical protein